MELAEQTGDEKTAYTPSTESAVGAPAEQLLLPHAAVNSADWRGAHVAGGGEPEQAMACTAGACVCVGARAAST